MVNPINTMVNHARWFVGAIGICVVSSLVVYALFQKVLLKTPLSPLASDPNITATPIPSPQAKIIYGFLPYWNRAAANHLPDNLLTHLAYFSFTVTPTGSLQTDLGSRRAGLIADIRAKYPAPPHLEATFSAIDDNVIASVLGSQEVQQTLVQSILTTADRYTLSGINIDFEPTADFPATTAGSFTAFITTLNTALKRHHPPLNLSVDIYATAASRPRIWDLATLAPVVDHVIVMTYDYYHPRSITAGPVSPLFGSEKNRYTHDIMKNLAELSPLLPAKKTLLGIPLYGYRWQTLTTNLGSQTIPRTGRTITYDDIRTLINLPGISLHWDADALEPWLSYTDNNIIRQAYYENARSIGYKLDLVNQSNLAGVALWAIGYEGDDTDLWAPFYQKFPRPATSH